MRPSLSGSPLKRLESPRFLARGAIFRVIYLSLWLPARLLGGEYRSGTENQIFLEFIGCPYLFARIYAFSRAAAQIAQERKMKRKDRAGYGGRAARNLPEFDQFLSLRLSAWRLGEGPGRRSKICQNLLGWSFLVTCGLIN